MKTLANLIWQTRYKAKLSQSAFAKKIGTTHAMVSLAEAGKAKSIPPHAFEAMVKIFGIERKKAVHCLTGNCKSLTVKMVKNHTKINELIWNLKAYEGKPLDIKRIKELAQEL